MLEYFYHLRLHMLNDQSADVKDTQTAKTLLPFLQTKARSAISDYDPDTCDIATDRRLDRITIEAVEMDDISKGIGTVAANINTKAYFEATGTIGDHGEVGIVQLYRDGEETPGLYQKHGHSVGPDIWSGNAPVKTAMPKRIDTDSVKDTECTTLCILAVPSYMSAADFLAFVGKKTTDAVSHFRMIRTSRLNRYMVLLKFRDGRYARQWQHEWNGTVFNSMEPETCHVVFVKSVTVTQQMETQSEPHKTSPYADNVSSQLLTHSSTSKPLAPPTPSLVELPTCPVCLERMDESTGLLTIPCQHVFHCTCLEKWSGGGCPVCRYTHDDFSSDHPGSRSSKSKKYLNTKGEYEIDDEFLECETCRETQSLWQCLICAKVGCGRYAGKHAFKHHQESGHSFALDLDSKRVWDYDHDCYVHRIIANGSTSRGEKVVELPGRRRDGQPTALEDIDEDLDVVKRENLAFEYTQLLTSQLDSQRVYFEELAARAADKSSESAKRADQAEAAAASIQSRYEGLTRQNAELQQIRTELEKLSARYEARCKMLDNDIKDLRKKYLEEKAFADMTSANAKELKGVSQAKFDEVMKKAKGLEEDCATKDLLLEAAMEESRDLRFRLDAERKLREMIESGEIEAGELEGATIEIGPGKKKPAKKKTQPALGGLSSSAEASGSHQGPTSTSGPQADLQALLGSDFQVASSWDPAVATQILFEKGLLQRKEEQGLYDDSDSSVEDSAVPKSKSKKKKKAKKKK